MMDQAEWRNVLQTYRDTWEDYASEAYRTQMVLAGVPGVPADAPTIQKILNQRLAENAKQEAFQHAREMVFAALITGSPPRKSEANS
jgi:hypothetical protein